MDVVVVLVFISLVLVFGALVFFASRLKDGDFDHGDRLALLPLQDDEGFDDKRLDDKILDDENIDNNGGAGYTDPGDAAATGPDPRRSAAKEEDPTHGSR